MKPLGGIVTSKKSIPENFRQVDNFTTEYLSKLWKIYTINRDVLDKGRRLENLFWRIWGSERIERTFSGAKVSAIFMMIVDEQGSFEQTEYRIPPRQIPSRQITAPPPHPMETFSIPRPSLEIQCPPTPPPSPTRPVTSVIGFQLGSSYLSKFPSQTAITASLQQAFPDAPPSPPIPSIRLSVTPIIPEVIEPSGLGSPQLPIHQTSSPNLSVIVSKNQLSYSTIASEEENSTSSKDGRKKGRVRKAKSERPPRGRRKIVTAKAITARTAAARKIRPAILRQKSSSSSNTAVNTAVSSPSNTLTTDIAQSLPSASQRQQQKNTTTPGGSESRGTGKKGDASASGWVVDPDFRTKYLERTRREKLLVALAPIKPATAKTTSATESVATNSAKISRGKGKNVLVVDEIVPLKGLAEDSRDGQVVKIRVGNSSDEGISELPSNLVRQKSELTLLFEGAKKAEEESGKKHATKKAQVIVKGEIGRYWIE